MWPSLSIRRVPRGHPAAPVPVTDPRYRRGVSPPNKGRTYKPEPLTVDEVRRLMAHMGRGSVGKRDRAWIVLAWRAGLRVSETLAVYPKDVDLELGTIRVLHGKGDKDGLVAIDAEACAVIAVWMAEREKLGLTGRHPLICRIRQPKRGGRMNPAFYRDKLPEVARKAGIEKRVHPHGLRHSIAFDLYFVQGKALGVIREHLRHKHLSTTFQYIDHLAPREALGEVRVLTWDGVATGDVGDDLAGLLDQLRQAPDAIKVLRALLAADNGNGHEPALR